MECDICKKNEAVIHVQQIMGSEKIDLHLCEECAREKGITGDADSLEDNLTKILKGILSLKHLHQEESEPRECPRCNISFDEFKKYNKAGCAECYHAFYKEISERLNLGNNTHCGKIPRRLRTFKKYIIDRQYLKRKLEEAVNAEDYEAAAELRDQIAALENPVGGAHDKSTGI